ncbi:MAG TPA: YhbY family RNA-binding protein [Chthoniobacteraceae bacterium]|nr:YhbY family RNA-binding protein [Chthoniobacteraceae bacterium]
MSEPKLGELKARAQLLQPLVRDGHDGISTQMLKALNDALDQHELVKIKFMAMKDQKKVLARAIEVQTDSKMVQRVGNTATYYRAKKSVDE